MRAGAFLAAMLIVAPAPMSAAFATEPQIVTSRPCDTSQGPCLRFGPASALTLPSVITDFAFTAPKGGGTAQVSIDGTMQCVNLEPSVSPNAGVIDLVAQIVDDNSAPSAGGLGGQHFAMRIPPTSTTEYSIPVNLGTRRVFKIAAGKHKFRYKMASQRMDTGIFCDIFNIYTSVVFVP